MPNKHNDDVLEWDKMEKRVKEEFSVPKRPVGAYANVRDEMMTKGAFAPSFDRPAPETLPSQAARTEIVRILSKVGKIDCRQVRGEAGCDTVMTFFKSEEFKKPELYCPKCHHSIPLWKTSD
jgi:hypothetical protein